MSAARGIRVTESSYRAGTVLPPHAHARPHFCLVLRGVYQETIDRRTLNRRPMSLSYQPAAVAHAEVHQRSGKHLMIEMSEEVVETVGANLKGPLDLSSTESLPIVLRIHDEFRNSDSLSPLAVEGLTLDLLAKTSRTKSLPERKKPSWLEPVEECLRDQSANPPSLDALADLAGVHPVHLARTFRRVHGRTIGEQVRAFRIDRARELLIETSLSLPEIGLKLGFYDQSHFTRSFRAITGATPGAYRRGLR